MGLRSLVQEEPQQQKRQGLRALASNPPTEIAEKKSTTFNVDGSTADRQKNSSGEIRNVPKRNPVAATAVNALSAFGEISHGITETVLPFGAGRKIQRKDVLPSPLVDSTMEFNRSLQKKPTASGVPVIGEAVDLFNIPTQFTPEVKARLINRKVGRIIGELARYAVIDRIAAGVKLPQIIQATMKPEAQQIVRQVLAGAMSGASENVPEETLNDALIGIGFRSATGAVAYPLFNKMIQLGHKMTEDALRENMLFTLREARALVKELAANPDAQLAKANQGAINTLLKTMAKLRARKLIRDTATSTPDIAKESEALASAFEDVKPKAAEIKKPAPEKVNDPHEQPVPTVKSEQAVQAQEMPIDKLRNEIVVLQLRKKDLERDLAHSMEGSARQAAIKQHQSLRESLKTLQQELGKRNLEKAREVKGLKSLLKETKKEQPAKPTEAPKTAPPTFLKAKTSASAFVDIAAKGSGIVKELSEVLVPGHEPAERVRIFGKIRRALDASPKQEVHIGTIPAGGADAKTRVKWEEFFPDELGLIYRRQGSLYNVYVPKDKADFFGTPTNIKPKRIDPAKEQSQIRELEGTIPQDKLRNIQGFAEQNEMSPKQYIAFLKNWAKKNAPPVKETKITPAQAKQGFPKEVAPAPVEPVAETLSEDDFFKSLGATKIVRPQPAIERMSIPQLKAKLQDSSLTGAQKGDIAKRIRELSSPKKTGKPVMALKDKVTGQVYSDPSANFHSDVMVKNKLAADNVERGVIVNGVYKAMDDSGLEPFRAKIHGIGNKANELTIRIHNTKQANPHDPKLPAMRKEHAKLMKELTAAKDELNREVARQTSQAGFARIGTGDRTEGTLPVPPSPQPAPADVRPRQFPDKGDINVNRFAPDVRQAIQEATVVFDISGKTRGRMSIRELEALAKKGDLTLDQLANLPAGTTLSAEEQLRARNLVETAFQTAKQDVDFALRRPDDPIAMANAAAAVKTALNVLITKRGTEAEAARAMRVLRTSNAVRQITTSEAQSILDGLSTNNFVSFMRNFSEAIERADINGAKRALGGLQRSWFEQLVNFSTSLYLTSPQTDIVNMTGNSIALLASLSEIPFQGATDAVISAIRRTPRTRLASEVVVEGYSFFEGMREGVGEFSKIMVNTLKGIEAPSGQVTDMQGGGTAAGSPLEFMSNLVFARLSASDAMFKAVKQRMSINGQAYRMAILEGLTGEAFANRVHALRNSPTKRMWEEATARALETTFQDPLGGISRHINALRHDPHLGVYARVLLPFFRTPVNLLRFAGRRSPLAAFPGSLSYRQMTGKALTIPRENPLPADVQQAQSEAIGRFVMGSMLAGWVVLETLKGNITGAGPADYKQRGLMEGKGWLASSFKVGDTYRSYRRFEPLAYVIQPIATMTERLIKPALGGKNVSYADIQEVVLQSLGFVLNSTFWRQVGELNDALAGKNRDFTANLIAGRIAIPGVQFINRTFLDPVQRKPKGLKETLMSRTPGLSQRIAPDITATGEERVYGKNPMERILPFQHADIVENQAFDELIRLHVNIPDQGETFKKVPLTMNERSEIEKEANKKINEVLNQFVAHDGYENLSDEQRKKSLETLISGIREAYAFKVVLKRRK